MWGNNPILIRNNKIIPKKVFFSPILGVREIKSPPGFNNSLILCITSFPSSKACKILNARITSNDAFLNLSSKIVTCKKRLFGVLDFLHLFLLRRSSPAIYQFRKPASQCRQFQWIQFHPHIQNPVHYHCT